MVEEAGFKVGDQFFPLTTKARLPDIALVEQVTGMTWSQFIERYALLDIDSPDDTLVTVGFLAMSIARKYPTWPRDRVLRYLNAIDEEDVQFIAPEAADDGEDDARPPADRGNGAPASSTPPAQSRSGSEQTSWGESNQKTSGTPTSATSPE